MKLHRLELTNYRGIAHRQIEFPDHGVIVVCGANEIGKTSMIEALDLLLESKDRSTKKDVKQVKPTHADVGSEVLAEISTGPYRFVYSKCFHKKFKTELTIVEPRREQLTGDEAHDRVRAMLSETVDTELWHAQRVLQAGSTAAVDLSGCDALSRALDVAAGDAADLSGTEPLLVERIDTEYARYFTATGRPTGEWVAAINQLRAAQEDVARCEAAVAEVDDRVRRHAELTQKLAGLEGQRQAVAQRCDTAEKVAAALADLAGQLGNARLVATAAAGTSAASAAAQAERERLYADVETRAAAVAELDAGVAASVEAQSTAREVADIASAAAAQSAAALVEAGARVEKAQRVVAALASREQADRLAAQLDRIDAAHREVGQIDAALAAISLTGEVMADIEAAASLVDRCEAQLQSSAATVEFTAAADLELTVGGQTVHLAAGERWSPPTAAASTVELPGLLSIRIDPGATTTGIQEKLVAAQHVLAEAVQQGGAADVADAREIDQRRRALVSSRDQMSATLAGLLGEEDVEPMRGRLAALHAAIAPELLDSGVTHEGAQAELTAAKDVVAAVTSQADTDRLVAAEADSQLTKKSTHTMILTEKRTVVAAELAAVRERLATARAATPDDELAVRAGADAEAKRRADAVAAELSERYAAADPDAVQAELDAARSAGIALERETTEIERALNDLTVELGVMGNEGRKGNLDVAEIAREHAAAEHDRVSRRARSAQLLRSVMARHRDNTRQRYVQPFRAEIERLGRPVFGPTFEVEVDSDLKICNRTLDGRTVPYESLSGGAKEQLGILARLAGAALVAKEDTVPVVIDDALGFTDPERLMKMGAVFDSMGNHGQVIVLTCTPTRYLGVEDAHVIELSA
jgi:AAA ATPase domain